MYTLCWPLLSRLCVYCLQASRLCNDVRAATGASGRARPRAPSPAHTVLAMVQAHRYAAAGTTAASHQHTQLTGFRQQSQPAATVSAWLRCQDLLPVVSGRYRQVQRHQCLCRHYCPADCVGDEKHLIFECSALDHIRHRFSVLFLGHHSVHSFMNQVSQRDVLHFVCDCLDYYSLLADVGVADAQ